jgi:hypothetical protein
VFCGRILRIGRGGSASAVAAQHLPWRLGAGRGGSEPG